MSYIYIHIHSFSLVFWQQLRPPAVMHHYIWEYSSVQIVCQVGRGHQMVIFTSFQRCSKSRVRLGHSGTFREG